MFDVTVHAWDLARSVDGDEQLDAALAAMVLDRRAWPCPTVWASGSSRSVMRPPPTRRRSACSTSAAGAEPSAPTRRTAWRLVSAVASRHRVDDRHRGHERHVKGTVPTQGRHLRGAVAAGRLPDVRRPRADEHRRRLRRRAGPGRHRPRRRGQGRDAHDVHVRRRQGAVQPPGQRPHRARRRARRCRRHRQPGLAGDGRRVHGHLPDGGGGAADVVAVRARRDRLPARQQRGEGRHRIGGERPEGA